MTGRHGRRLGALTVGLGAVVMVAGTFAPWLRSGESTRNSYRTAGLMQRLLGIDGVAGAALDALPLLAVACAGLLVVAISGFGRTALAIGTLLAAAMSALSVAALAAPAAHGVRVTVSGPIVTLAGSVLMIVAATGLMIMPAADTAGTTGTDARPTPASNPPAPENLHDQSN